MIEAAVNSRAKPKVIVEDRKEEQKDDDSSSPNNPESQHKILSANEQADIEIDKDAKWI